MGSDGDRRPLASRNTSWAHTVTRWLATTSVTPNQISIIGMAAAAVSGVAFYFAGQSEADLRFLMLICGALFCQMRLLCNLMDGMVAVEEGKGTPDGVFWNEVPDRISDILILAGIGYGIDAPTIGWAAAAFSVLTAYVRELGSTSGARADFRGPMAKPHRMAVVTLASVFTMFAPLWNGHNQALLIALWVIAIGACGTAIRRSVRLINHLKKKTQAADAPAHDDPECVPGAYGRVRDHCGSGSAQGY